jgi:hypothetical protein
MMRRVFERGFFFAKDGSMIPSIDWKSPINRLYMNIKEGAAGKSGVKHV